MGVIYLRTNLTNGMQYVGQTVNFPKRESHWKCLKHRYANQLLTDDREKYGFDSFNVEILKECDNIDLDFWERYYIEKYNTVFPNGYNANEGGTINFKHSENTKKKISEANSGENNGMFGVAPWNKGSTLSTEIKQKLSVSHKGNKSALGHILTDESKQKISKSKKGVPNLALSKAVIQVSQNGEITRYNSVADAKRKGFCGVDRVCRGERPMAYNSKWYYEDYYKKMLGEKNS